MDVTNLSGKVVLVTGAGSGIGRETALAFARLGAAIVVCDVNGMNAGRTVADIQAAGGRASAHVVDVADRAQMERFAEDVHREHPAVDVLVNNAGVGLGGGFLDTSLEDWDWILGINLRGVIHGCHFFVPKMVARGAGGHVVNVASAAAFVAGETLSAYCTTKFAVLGLSESLRDELARHGIGVTAICPGIINTPITGSSRMRGKAAAPGAQERLVEFYKKRNYGPDKVAQAIVAAVGSNTAVAPVSPEAWFMYLMKRVSPSATAWLNQRMTERFEKQIGASSSG